MKSKPKKTRGVNVTVSVEAHQILLDKVHGIKPRRTLREQVNIDYNLPIDK